MSRLSLSIQIGTTECGEGTYTANEEEVGQAVHDDPDAAEQLSFVSSIDTTFDSVSQVAESAANQPGSSTGTASSTPRVAGGKRKRTRVAEPCGESVVSLKSCMRELLQASKASERDDDDIERFGKFVASLVRRKPEHEQQRCMNQVLALLCGFRAAPTQLGGAPSSNQDEAYHDPDNFDDVAENCTI